MNEVSIEAGIAAIKAGASMLGVENRIIEVNGNKYQVFVVKL